MADIKEIVEKWLIDGKDYREGVLVLSKYCTNQSILPGLYKDENPLKADKLLYELTKLAKIPEAYEEHSTFVKKEIKKHQIEQQRQVAERLPEKDPDSKIEVKGDDPLKRITDKTIMMVGTNHVPFNKLPIVIQEVIKQKGNLYRQREQLHDELKSVPKSNKKENIDKRAAIAEKIDHFSKRIDFLYNLQNQFKIKKVVPKEEVMNWNPEPVDTEPKIINHTKLSDIELKKRQSNVRGNITKTKNQLLYRANSKKEKRNPYPDGPKKTKYETKLRKLEFELQEIEKELEKRSK